jgi:hypothetical protein
LPIIVTILPRAPLGVGSIPRDSRQGFVPNGAAVMRAS